MKKKIWFQTDLGYEATKQRLIEQKDFFADMEGYKGILTFYLKNMKDFTIQITTKGKLGIFYPGTANYEIVLEKLKNILVKADGSPTQKLEKIEESEIPDSWEIKEKHSKFGFFERLLKDRSERKRKEQEKIDKEHLLGKIHYEELLAKYGGKEWAIMKDLAAQDRETFEKLWKSKH